MKPPHPRRQAVETPPSISSPRFVRTGLQEQQARLRANAPPDHCRTEGAEGNSLEGRWSENCHSLQPQSNSAPAAPSIARRCTKSASGCASSAWRRASAAEARRPSPRRVGDVSGNTNETSHARSRFNPAPAPGAFGPLRKAPIRARREPRCRPLRCASARRSLARAGGPRRAAAFARDRWSS
jgi:hypothetical protein